MKYQTNPELGPFLNHWGCHFCCILEKVEIKTNQKFSNAEVVAIYQKAMSEGYVQKEVRDHENHPIDGCTILDGDKNGAGDGDKIFNLGAELKGSPIRAIGYRWESKDYVIKPNEEEILELKRVGYPGSHFVSGTGVPHPELWQHEIEFDPIEDGSQCARHGWIESKRILSFA